jgi:multidrug efflux pump subunit AcrA (membrane-fusion protein)
MSLERSAPRRPIQSSPVTFRQTITTPFLVIGLILLLGCTKSEPPAALPPAVKIFEVGTSIRQSVSQDVPESYSTNPRGRQDPLELRSELSGTVIEVLVKPGQSVKAGQSLIRLDPRDAKLANSSAQVQVQAARARLANVEADFNRYTELLTKGFISKAEWDRREATLIAERAQFEATLDQLGVYTLRALESGRVRKVLATTFESVQASELLIQFQSTRAQPGSPRLAGSRSETQSKQTTSSSQAESYLIPLTALLDGRRVMRVVPRDDHFLVEPIAVNVLESTEQLARVEGLLKGDSIVAVGAHLLSPGQEVRRLQP